MPIIENGLIIEIEKAFPPPQISGGGSFQVLNPAQYPNFTLTTPVAVPSLSRLYIRGIKQYFGTDYIFQSSTLLQWVGTPINIPNPVFELYS